MSKNNFCKFGILLLVANQSGTIANSQIQDNKPNILLIMSDEHPWWYSGAYGHPNIITPNIDKLAENGIVFDAAYCNSPMCAPARASLLTGRHVTFHEVWDNSAPLRDDIPTYAHSFTAGGYRTIYAGKMHVMGANQLHGFMERWTQTNYPATFDWTQSNRHGAHVNQGQNIDRVFEAGVGRTTDYCLDDETLFRVKHGLRYLNRLEDDIPFFLQVSFNHPHYPFVAPQEYYDMYSYDDVIMPELPEGFWNPENLKNESSHLQWSRQHGKLHKPVPDDVLLRASRAIKARTTILDEYIGEIIDLLKELDMYENTIIIYTSDHGSHMGERGLWHKNTAMDPSAKIPMIFAGPNIPGGRRTSEAVSLMDFGPTLTSLAGIDMIYPVTDGRDFSDLVLGKRESLDGLVIFEQYGEGTHRGYRMVRKGKYKLIYVPDYAPGGGVDLYDLENDPGEWNDLSEKEEYQDILKELTQIALDGWTNHEELDERRWLSEERRLSIMKAPTPPWNYKPPPVPHPVPGFGVEEYWVGE